jgi:hypothetical protein
MIVNLDQSLGKKEIRTLKCLWGMLCNKKRYFLPTTIDDLKICFTTKIKIDGIEYYFSDKLNQNFRKFANTIYDHSTITEYF